MSDQQSFVDLVKGNKESTEAELTRLRLEVERCEEAFEYHRRESEEKSKTIARLIEERDRAICESVVAREMEGTISRKAYNTLLRLTGGIVIAVYGFNPSDKRSEVVSSIQNDLDLKGVNLDADTIRKYLREAVALLEAAGKLSGKPK